MPSEVDLARELEVSQNRLARALDVLDRIEAIVKRAGGFMSTPDQDTVREARALLVESGKRKSDAPAIWKDRP